MALENSPNGIKNIMKFNIKEWFSKIKEFIKNLTPKQKMYISVGCVLGFILINSMLNGEVSFWISKIPQTLYQSVIPYGKFPLIDDFLINHIRKFAHFLEYMIFGMLVSKYYLFKKLKVNRFINSIYIVLSISFVDETIQLISGRESLVSDIWLDLFGGVVGILVYFIYRYYKFQRKQKEKNKWKLQ